MMVVRLAQPEASKEGSFVSPLMSSVVRPVLYTCKVSNSGISLTSMVVNSGSLLAYKEVRAVSPVRVGLLRTGLSLILKLVSFCR